MTLKLDSLESRAYHRIWKVLSLSALLDEQTLKLIFSFTIISRRDFQCFPRVFHSMHSFNSPPACFHKRLFASTMLLNPKIRKQHARSAIVTQHRIFTTLLICFSLLHLLTSVFKQRCSNIETLRERGRHTTSHPRNDFFTCCWLQTWRINMIQSVASFSPRQSSGLLQRDS